MAQGILDVEAPRWGREPASVTDGPSRGEGTRVFVLGEDPADAEAPAVVLLEMPPHYVLFRHAHICHRFEVVVRGSLQAGGRTLGPGDVMTARPGELYGPHVAGPAPRGLDPLPFRERNGAAEVTWIVYQSNTPQRIVVSYQA